MDTTNTQKKQEKKSIRQQTRATIIGGSMLSQFVQVLVHLWINEKLCPAG